MLRASIANFRAGHVVQGGSTITQQVAKSLLLHSREELRPQDQEVILTCKIEQQPDQAADPLSLSQRDLPRPWRLRRAGRGRTYFRKDVSELTVAEAAILAGMPQAPGKYSPLLNPKKAKERQLYVLRRMYENGYITQPQMTEALAAANQDLPRRGPESRFAPYLVEHLRRYLIEKYGEKAVYEGGMTIYTPTTPTLSLAPSEA